MNVVFKQQDNQVSQCSYQNGEYEKNQDGVAKSLINFALDNLLSIRRMIIIVFYTN